MDLLNVKQNIIDNGFAVIDDIFSSDEVERIVTTINQADTSSSTFRKSADLFAIRQFLKEVPTAQPLIFSNKFNSLLKELFGHEYFVTKAIYFDKPEQSNWFVSYHQDLTISVDRRIDIDGFVSWTVKQNKFSVQPPLHILQHSFTARIHLDDTDESNGALKVVPKSHLKGLYRPETIDWSSEMEVVCKVKKGGIMIMRPLLLHSSSRTTNNKKRRVIHIEFSNQLLPHGLKWSELSVNQ